MYRAKEKILVSLMAFVLICTLTPATMLWAQPEATGDGSVYAADLPDTGTFGDPTGTGDLGNPVAPSDDGGSGSLLGDEGTDEAGFDDTLTEAELESLKAQVLDELEGNEAIDYVAGEVIIVFKDEVTSDEAGEILKEVDAIDEASVQNEAMISKTMAVVELNEGTSVIEAIAELNDNPDVAYAQPNYLYRILENEDMQKSWFLAAVLGSGGINRSSDASIPSEIQPFIATEINDSLKLSQWALTNLRLYDAWTLTRCNNEIAIAVIDTGVMTEHEDLTNIIIPGSYYDATKTGQTGDPQGHGTAVTGIIAAQANNNLGVAGASFNARVIPICAGYFNAENKYIMDTASVSAGYAYLLSDPDGNGKTVAQEANCKVVNISLGGPTPDYTLEKWINQAYSAGILTISAAGNIGSFSGVLPNAPIYPGSFEKCINVSALKQGPGTLNDVFDGSYSFYGSTVNLSAPGTSIRTTRTYTGLPTSLTAYSYNSGTSMASPLVAATAALVFAANPSLTPAQVRSALESTASDLGDPGWDQYYGCGEVNPYAAAMAVGATVISNTSPGGPGYAVTCSASSTLPMATSWQWSIMTGSGTINPVTGVLIPSSVGEITVKATYTQDSNIYATKVIKVGMPAISYSTHVQNVGWQTPVPEGQVSGTSGMSLRLEGLKINLVNNTGNMGGIKYSTHIQNIGWQTAVAVANNGVSTVELKGSLSGTEGQSLRLEAMTLEFTGDLAFYYDIYYRVHAQDVGWMGWAKNGERAGTAGHSLRLEALQIVIVVKGAAAPPSTYNGISAPVDTPYYIDPAVVSSGLSYSAVVHIQNIGDKVYSTANGTTQLGTSGQSFRLESLILNLKSPPYTGGITYETHIQNIGWQGAKTEGQVSGTSGQSLRLEALRINLKGNMLANYDVYYRTHIQYIGWTGWAKNGQSCGSAGYSYRMEAMQILILPKGLAPGFNSGYFYQS